VRIETVGKGVDGRGGKEVEEDDMM